MSDDSDTEDPHQFQGFYGKALEPYDEESIPKKRPIAIEEQVAKDAQGRRRFHGAFTGGFSAGFFNTVGSLEGWRPTEFKSSRSEKAHNKIQRPEDYMDDEDMGEFGIAPQTVKATDEYNTSKKRKRQVFSDGPIPGDPVLHTLIESGNETIGYLLLRNMGYKHGDEDVDANEENANEAGQDDDDDQVGDRKVYGCEMPKTYQIKKSFNNITYNIHDIYKSALQCPKANTFGMGYSGLDRSHINLFTSSKLVVNERNNKKLSISGQAFGVGAFENDDEDIYVKEDMSNYDFEMKSEKTKEKKRERRKLIFDVFVASENSYPMIEKFLPPTIPASFTGKHKVKKSRFEPLEQTESTSSGDKVSATPKRHEIDASTRAAILGEDTSRTNRSAPKPTPPKSSTSTPTTSKENEAKIKSEEVTQRSSSSMFDVGPSGLIFDKFVSAGKSEEHADILEAVAPSETTHGTKDMREASKMKMFGPLTRITVSWLPCSLLCKRFDVPEPVFGDVELKSRQKRHRNLIFESASGSISTPETQITHTAGLHTTTTSKPDPTHAQAISTSTTPTTTTTEIPLRETISESTRSASNNATNTNIANVSITITPPTTLIQQLSNSNIQTPSSSTPSTATPTSSISILSKVITTTNTEEKKALDPTEKLNISKNVDLFKAVFMDSDSDEEDNETDNNNTPLGPTDDDKHHFGLEGDKPNCNDSDEDKRIRDDEIKAKILSEDLLLPQIKPIKQGILSNVESIMFDKPPTVVQVQTPIQTQTQQTNREEAVVIKERQEDGTKHEQEQLNEDNMYGPRLPSKITFRKPQSGKSANLPKADSNSESASSEDDWVELVEVSPHKNAESEKKRSKKNAKSHKHKKEKKHKTKKKHKKRR